MSMGKKTRKNKKNKDLPSFLLPAAPVHLCHCDISLLVDKVKVACLSLYPALVKHFLLLAGFLAGPCHLNPGAVAVLVHKIQISRSPFDPALTYYFCHLITFLVYFDE